MTSHQSIPRFFLALFVLLATHAAVAQQSGYSPKIAPASNEGETAIAGFQVPKGMEVRLFAAEPLVANPVAFCIDEQGRILVAETFRQQKGVEDNRNHMVWLHDDLAAQTVEDRLAYFKKHLGDKVNEYALEHDRIRIIQDHDGDGTADESYIFADGFNDIVEGTGAGLLARQGNVYYTCIPKLWLLKDEDGDKAADVREPLHNGYGVRVAFRGHDSHGLVMGPDGRLYFSIGDRGYNVVTQEGKRLARPYTGAVFRCEPDGSKLEVFAYGLRNPQELAFDDFGNLFTGDNNSDSGDKARWVYLVEGGDTGWRMYYQYLQDRGPWNRERIWHPYRSDDKTTAVQPAFCVPPIINIADGPSGLAYYPGVGLSDRYKGHFFLADFRGTANRSGIRSFAVKPKGASFELVDSHQFLWQILATDIDFGYDGNIYATDWVNGWNGLGKGRIYSFRDNVHARNPAISEAAESMAEGFEHRTASELIGLLEHADRRIRQEAQFALVKQQKVRPLIERVSKEENQLARLHCVWGLGQLVRQSNEPFEALVNLLNDSDAEVRAQAAKVLAENHGRQIAPKLVLALADEHPRVRFFAAISLGRLIQSDTSAPLVSEILAGLLRVLIENNNEDPMLRHAGVMGLTGIGQTHLDALLSKAKETSPAARMGVLLALRRLHRPEVSQLLDDADPSLIVEAARAIHDEPIESEMPRLASLADRPGLPDAFLRRVLSANFRVGKLANAQAVARIAADSNNADVLRLEAVEELHQWQIPGPLDRVLGDWRPLSARPNVDVASAIRPVLGGLFEGSDKLRSASAKLAAHYGIKEVGPVLFELLADKKSPANLRVSALSSLETLEDERLTEATELAIADSHPRIRAEGRRLFAKVQPTKAIDLLDTALEAGETIERQSAVDVLSNMNLPDADALLIRWLDKLIARDVPEEIQLDLLNAAGTRGTPLLKERVAKFETTRAKDDPLSQYRECISGGDVERGREIFFGRAELSCRRCHVVQGSGGEVGPDLSKIGKDKKRDYLLEAIVLPNKTIAKGFETAVLAMLDGKVYVGIVKEDKAETLKLMLADGTVINVNKEDIDERVPGKSAMPEQIIKQLSKADIRDLVEYLSTLKAATP